MGLPAEIVQHGTIFIILLFLAFILFLLSFGLTFIINYWYVIVAGIFAATVYNDIKYSSKSKKST